MTAAVAAFDLDGTLTHRDCMRPFLVALGGWHGIAAAAARHPVASVRAAGTGDRDSLKEIVVGGLFRGRLVIDVEARGERFAEQIAAHFLRADTLARLRWHQDRGHATVVVSASLGPYLRPLGRTLALDGVLCTDVVDDGVRYGDALRGGNCRAGEKARRLTGWLDDAGLGEAEVWAYGDSRGDREMLAMSHHPVWVDGKTVSEQPS